MTNVGPLFGRRFVPARVRTLRLTGLGRLRIS